MKHDIDSSLTLDEWVDLTKTFGPSEFKRVGVEFLREYYGRQVIYIDGKGDGGIDAWVIFQSEPQMRQAGQFHAGKSKTWDAKLAEDLATMKKYRDSLAPDNSSRSDFKRMSFVTSQITDATHVETRTQELLEEYGVNVRVFDARAIVSIALQNKSGLWAALARQLPGYDATENPSQDPREEALLAFSFFHEKPRNYRWDVAKSAIATVLHRHKGSMSQDDLVTKSMSILRLTGSQTFIERAIRNLRSEKRIDVQGETVIAQPALTDGIRASLALAQIERKKLHEQCLGILESFIPKGKHHKRQLAERAVEAIFDDLGLLIKYPIEEQVLFSVDPSKQPRSRYERETFKRWKTAAIRVEAELGADEEGHRALEAVVKIVALSPFAKNLAAAELFLRLTEYDAHEFAQALTTSSQSVLLDTNVALPMICALFDRPVNSWATSLAAYEFYKTLKERGIRCVIPSVYLEEMAMHLLNARDFADLIESDAELERSHNYFVAHYCSSYAHNRSRVEFLKFLTDFGAHGGATPKKDFQLPNVMYELRQILDRYAIKVEDFEQLNDDEPELPNEPARRLRRLINHDRTVVRILYHWAKSDPRWIVCSADGWLRTVLNDKNIVAMDCVGLADLLELVRPTSSSRTLLSPLELASSIGEQERELAASVWDEIVKIEGAGLSNREVLNQARGFRNAWLAKPQEEEISVGWTRFREAEGKREAS